MFSFVCLISDEGWGLDRCVHGILMRTHVKIYSMRFYYHTSTGTGNVLLRTTARAGKCCKHFKS